MCVSWQNTGSSIFKSSSVICNLQAFCLDPLRLEDRPKRLIESKGQILMINKISVFVFVYCLSDEKYFLNFVILNLLIKSKI